MGEGLNKKLYTCKIIRKWRIERIGGEDTSTRGVYTLASEVYQKDGEETRGVEGRV